MMGGTPILFAGAAPVPPPPAGAAGPPLARMGADTTKRGSGEHDFDKLEVRGWKL